MAYTTVDKSGLNFKAKLYTGNESAGHAITGVGFQPDFTWIKVRGTTDSNSMYDAVRGVTKEIKSDSTDAETTQSTGLTSFDSDGFTVGTRTLSNSNNQSIISWNWKANGQGSANSDGSITTTYTSANTASGFSIIKYTGTGSSATIGHGLSATPKVCIFKQLDGTESWRVWHRDAPNYSSKALALNLNSAEFDQTNWVGTVNNSTIALGTDGSINLNAKNYICYAFAEKAGFSKAGMYQGNNNADGPFVYTGFKPAFIMIKSTGLARNWTNWDNARDIFNPHWNYIYPNLAQAGTNIAHGSSGSYAIDFLSNGFKLKNTDDKFNGSGQSYIYMAFGQSLVGSNNIPCTAR
tara:strand:+ start:702 stop:1754 length:1053 start_codon:yes stop_codon:yes gene_type:complete